MIKKFLTQSAIAVPVLSILCINQKIHSLAIGADDIIDLLIILLGG